MGGKPRRAATRLRRTDSTDPCQSVYRFIRLCLGEDVSDREIARRWGMEWKSFVALKQGRRRLPRLDELERLGTEVLGIDPAFVFQVGSGVPAERVAAFLSREHQLRALLERVTDAILTVDPGGRLRDVNLRFCELLGREPDELMGRPLHEFASPDSVPALIAALAAVMRDGEIRGVEIAFQHHNGTERIVDLSATRIPGTDGSAIGAQAIARDVTTERRLFRQLESERRLLQTIYDCVPAACILFDRDGTIVAANAIVNQVCPISSEEMIGKTAFEVFGEPGPAGSPVTRAFLTGRTEQQVSRAVNRSGDTIYVHRIAGPVTSGGRVDKVIEMLVDVTEQLHRGDLRVALLMQEPTTLPSGAPIASDRRSSPRAHTAFTARIATGARRDTALVTNLSAGGLFLETRRSAPRGEEVKVEWTLPGDDSPVRTRGIVAWTRSSAVQDRPIGLGIRFVAVDPEFAAVTSPNQNKT